MLETVEFRIGNLSGRVNSTRDAIPFSVVDGSDVVIVCPPNSGATVNDKIVWLWGLLTHKRRIIKSLQADGATLQCICKTSSEDLTLLPNAAEFLHLTGTTLVISRVGL
jgi:hypothetical protein